VVEAIAGCDTVIYDTHFTPEEYTRFPHYGHSTPEHAIELCAGQGIRCLVLYHHAPTHSDATMDEIAAEYARRGAEVGLEVVTAREHQTLPVGGAALGARA
jgi:ribonuclease BN (tRNA processing enzyme)